MNIASGCLVEIICNNVSQGNTLCNVLLFFFSHTIIRQYSEWWYQALCWRSQDLLIIMRSFLRVPRSKSRSFLLSLRKQTFKIASLVLLPLNFTTFGRIQTRLCDKICKSSTYHPRDNAHLNFVCLFIMKLCLFLWTLHFQGNAFRRSQRYYFPTVSIEFYDVRHFPIVHFQFVRKLFHYKQIPI